MPRLQFRRILLASVLMSALSSSAAQAQLVSTNYYGNAVLQYSTTDGSFQSVINNGTMDGTPGANGLVGPSGVTLDAANNIYFSGSGDNASNGAIYKYTASTGLVSVFITPAQLSAAAGGGSYSPTALKFGSDGKLYVARSVGQGTTNLLNGTIDRFNVTPTAGTFDLTVATGLTQPSGLIIRGNDMYVSNLRGTTQDTNGNTVATTGDIFKIPSFIGATSPITPVPYISPTLGNAGGLQNPTGLAFDDAGNLYVADVAYDFNCGVRKYGPGGTSGPNSMIISHFLAFTSDVLLRNGKLYVADLGYPGVAPGGIYTYDQTTLQPIGNPLVSGFGYSAIAIISEPTSLLAFTLVGGLIAYRRKR